MDDAAVVQLLEERKRELLRLHLRRSAGQVDKTHQFAALRRDIARLCTVRAERHCAEGSRP